MTTMAGKYHRCAGEATFVTFGLQHDRDLPVTKANQVILSSCLPSGLNNQAARFLFSAVIWPVTVMPGR